MRLKLVARIALFGVALPQGILRYTGSSIREVSEAVASMVVFCAGQFVCSVVCGGKAAESELAGACNDGVCCWCCEMSDHTLSRPALVAPVLLGVLCQGAVPCAS